MPLPLQAIIEAMVRKGFDDWLRSALIEPNRMRLSILADKLRYTLALLSSEAFSVLAVGL